MPNFLLISFFALVVLWPISLAIDTEDVKDFEDEFSLLTSSTWDTISKLRLVSQVSFVRVAGPVGALIAAGADVAFKPDSEELKAMEKLHDYVKTQFGVLSRQKVTDPLDAIERFYFGITDPSGNRSGYKEEFISRCKGFSSHRSPRGILIKMKRNLLLNCRLPSAAGNETQSYADVLALFQKIEKHLLNMSISSEEYEFLKNSLLAKSTWVHDELKTIPVSNKP
ncbi:hypothetical protein niasHS_009706 [Heterodera schachtii]|uniref:Uncharacterized protein n=1 Tax=Heterodera schachtii TaxID=97005 RepID=A0ABD2J551_HETSC